MKHKKRGRIFGRTAKLRRALMKGLLKSLISQSRVSLTLARAKELRALAEKLVTKAKKGGLNQRREVAGIIGGKEAEKLFSFAPSKFKNRAGGYTRILKTGRRSHDRAEMAILEFVE